MQEYVFGIAAARGRVREGVLSRLRRRSAERSLRLAEIVAAGNVSVALLRGAATEDRGRVHEAAGRLLAWTGHIVLPQLDLWPSAAQLLEYLEPDLPERLAGADGLFALAHYDAGLRQLWLAADPFGVFPLYYARCDDAVLFSTSCDLLLSAGPEKFSFNAAAAAQYVHFHHCLGDETLAREIKRVPQGTLLRFHLPGRDVSATTTFSCNDLPKPDDPSATPASEEVALALRAAIQRRLRHDAANVCLLSGGWDSRTLCGLLRDLECRYATWTTYGDVGRLDDPDAARLVAAVLDVENTYVPLPEDYLERHWREKCLLTDFGTTMHTWLMPLALRHAAAGAVNFDGIAGDVTVKGLLLGAAELDLLARRERAALAEAVFKRHALGAVLDHALNERIRPAWRQHACGAMERELARWEAHPNTLSFFVLTNRTRRAIGTAPCGVLDLRLHNVAPFLDRQFLALAMAIPPELKLGGTVYRRLLRHLNPRLADLPSSNDRQWPPDCPRRVQPRMCVTRPDPFCSYLAEIDTAGAEFCELLDRAWLDEIRRAATGNPAARARCLSDLQAVAELAFWLNTYGRRVAFCPA